MMRILQKKKKSGGGAQETHAFYINCTYPKTEDRTLQKGKQDTQFLGWTESNLILLLHFNCFSTLHLHNLFFIIAVEYVAL